VALLVIQAVRYGSPFSSGYGSLAGFFSLVNIAPNLRDYTVRLLRGEPAAIGLLVVSLLIVVGRRATRPLGYRTGRVGVARPLAWCGGTVLACYLPYGVFPDWFYLRFLLPALPLFFIAVAAVGVAAAARLPPALRAPAVLLAAAIICAVNVVVAGREHVFTAKLSEARYRTAGRYLAAVLPPEAVIVAVQQSGSARYYARRPVVRWDLLNINLDEAVLALRQAGHLPVILVEDWERAKLQARHPASGLARLDWQPRAAFGDPPVRFFDPVDREAQSGRPVDVIR
jgi:hypothetical protein